jgi:DNA-binding response OmpR family regulator
MTRPRILIVEDDPSTRRVLHQIFAHRGWDVRPTASVAEAISEATDAPDYAIIDLMLPNGDGEQILELLQRSHAKTRTVVVTAVADPERMNAVQSRFNPAAILVKPVNLDQLLCILEPIHLSNPIGKLHPSAVGAPHSD